MLVGCTTARVFALLALAGLVLAPIARPAMAMPAGVHSGMDENMTSGPMAAAPGRMPCCPSQPSLPDCDKDCPFMAPCAPMALHTVAQNSLIVPLTLAAVISPSGSAAVASLSHTPPRKPPKV